MKNNDALDLTKFILSLLVICIHVNPFGEFRDMQYPVTRIAIPMFFMISGYLLFTRVNACRSDQERDRAIKSFCLREMKLYLFWLIVLLPAVLKNNDYFSTGIAHGLLRILSNLFLGSTFIGSWFISASIVCVLLIYYTGRHLSNRQLIIIGILLYLLSCLSSNYFFLFGSFSTGSWLIRLFGFLPEYLFISFPAGFIWIVFGKYFAEQKHDRGESTASLTLKFCLSFAGLYFEKYLISVLKCGFTTDCYIMLMPACYFLFQLVLRWKVSIRNAKVLRRISIVSFCIHPAIQQFLLGVMGWEQTPSFPLSVVFYLIVVALCIAAALLLQYLQKLRGMHWLKYAY